jgi:hypothetical protein
MHAAILRSTAGLLLAAMILASCDKATADMSYPEPPAALVAHLQDVPIGSEGQAKQNAQIKTVERALETRFAKANWDKTILLKPANQEAFAAYYDGALTKAGWKEMPPFDGLSSQFQGSFSGWQKGEQLFAILLWTPYGDKGEYMLAETFSAGLNVPQ